jgi:hypothetical protein
MRSSSVLLSSVCLALVSVLAGCSHQATPAASAAQVGHPSIGFAVKGPPAEQAPEDREPRDRQDAPIVDAMHGFSRASPR